MAFSMVWVASKSTDRFSGLDMWRSSVSAASDARRALPGEATRLAVVAVRARVVADGRLLCGAGTRPADACPCNGCGLPEGLQAMGYAAAVMQPRGCATDAGLQNRCGAASDEDARNEEVAKPKFYLL